MKTHTDSALARTVGDFTGDFSKRGLAEVAAASGFRAFANSSRAGSWRRSFIGPNCMRCSTLTSQTRSRSTNLWTTSTMRCATLSCDSSGHISRRVRLVQTRRGIVSPVESSTQLCATEQKGSLRKSQNSHRSPIPLRCLSIVRCRALSTAPASLTFGNCW